MTLLNIDIIASSLPTELIQQIYFYLGPIDFNAARHTCRSWLAASGNMKLLHTQLKRGGWTNNIEASCLSTERRRNESPVSRYLALECALSGKHGQDEWSDNHIRPICSIDYTALNTAGADAGSLRQDVDVCATSTCGKYFVTAAGTEIYTYAIDGSSICLLSTTSCERKVRAVAIDARLDRFVLAVLLDGRIGLYIDMSDRYQPPKASKSTLAKLEDEEAIENVVRDVFVGDFDEMSINAESLGSTTVLHQSVEIVTQRRWLDHYHGSLARLRGMRQMPTSSNGIWPDNLNLRAGDGRAKPKTSQIVYRNICSAEDPPCSVAISPTRQCVAFGSKNGVELYWIDSTTGRNLNRWFPLTRPSDHLYFLPPRRSKDQPSRLRLISTAEYCPSSSSPKPESPGTQLSSWFGLSASWRFPVRTGQDQIGSDHSYAVPLSDGHHMLFTDNETGLLCLGSDKSAGSAQRLSRKFVFEPPQGLYKESTTALKPTVCAAADDLSNEIRIVAGYGDNIALFSVPIDIFKYSTAEQEQTLQDSPLPFEEMDHISVLSHPASNAQAIRQISQGGPQIENLNMLWAHYRGGEGRKSLDDIWPLKIAGVYIGSMTGLKALSVQVDGRTTIWGFSNKGDAMA